MLRYTGLIAVTAPSTNELDTAVAAIEQAAIQASCETRLLVGQQAQAFTAAALPLCRNDLQPGTDGAPGQCPHIQTTGEACDAHVPRSNR